MTVNEQQVTKIILELHTRTSNQQLTTNTAKATTESDQTQSTNLGALQEQVRQSTTSK